MSVWLCRLSLRSLISLCWWILFLNCALMLMTQLLKTTTILLFERTVQNLMRLFVLVVGRYQNAWLPPYKILRQRDCGWPVWNTRFYFLDFSIHYNGTVWFCCIALGRGEHRQASNAWGHCFWASGYALYSRMEHTQQTGNATNSWSKNQPRFIFEGSYVSALIGALPAHSLLFSANSMAIRAIDTFYVKQQNTLLFC